MENIGLMTNDELKKKKRELLNEFENQKSIIAKAYTKMLSLQQENSEIDKILNKREGNG
jgi:predicted nuclease with TOPRIM domain